MKKILLLSAILLITITSARAQLRSTVTTLTHDHTFSAGRDFWFSEQSNYWGVNLGGKYLRIYITSTKNTTAFVEYSGGETPLKINANQVATFLLPEFIEMESSGVVENKAIHVWSNDADLIVYNMSRNSATSDGEYIIPTIAWGTDYVVAAFASLFEGGGSYVYDLPSTCVITANENNTLVSITPSCDCRQCYTGSTAGNSNSTVVVFPQGQTFTDTLNQGQCLELMPVKAQGPDNYDMTGTIIHANVPVGVAGGSVCPNIPENSPYCDHVEDMLPPVRTWGKTYYSTSFQIPAGGDSTHDFAMYLFVASEPNQTIFRQQCNQAAHTECIINNQYGLYWDELENTQKFWSSAPFMLVQYMNSASYPDGTNGSGDPAEAHVNPREQFTKTVTFETPVNTGGQYPDPYYNYADVVVNDRDASKTLLDGKRLTGRPGKCVDTNWEIFAVTNIAAGAHTITGDDSGVGVHIYGFGYDESYEWSSQAQAETFQSTDTAPPVVTISGMCAADTVTVSDTGQFASQLDMLRLDSAHNMTYIPAPTWEEGTVRNSTYYSMYVNDLDSPAYLQISAFDYAGNHTTITTTYTPLVALTIQPAFQNLGDWVAGNPPNVAFDTIDNTGPLTDTLTEIQLRYGYVGFSLFDSIGGPVDLSPLAPGKRRIVEIQFEAHTFGLAVDSMIVGTACGTEEVAVMGTGYLAFIASSNPFDTCQVGTSKTVGNVTVRDTSATNTVVIDSIWTDNPVFTYDSTKPASNILPITLSPLSLHVLFVTFTPTAPVFYTGHLFMRGVGEGVVTVPLTGTGYTLVNSVQSMPSQTGTLASWEPPAPNPAAQSLALNYSLANGKPALVTFDVFSTLGERVYHWDGGIQSAGPHRVSLDMGTAIPDGSYLYRFEANGDVRSGNLEIER